MGTALELIDQEVTVQGFAELFEGFGCFVS